MASVVEKLQQDALDPNTRVSDLLRRVKFTAVQLGLGQVEDWVEHELNGYSGIMPPDYRMVHGRPMAHHNEGGWQELPGPPDFLRKRTNNQAISALEAMLATATSDTQLHIPFPEAIAKELNESNGKGWSYYLVIAPSEVARIVDRVRNLVLDWALNLQKAGVMGSEISFNEAEKEKAQTSSTTINIGSIGNFAGNIGSRNVSGNNEISADRISSVVDQIKPNISALVASGASGDLLDRINAIEAALADPKPEPSTIRGLLTDLRNSLSGAAGNLLASGAIAALNLLLGTGVPSP